MVMRTTATDLARNMHVHPIVAELLPIIAGELKSVG
jgi:hypothetical protein